MRFPYVYRQNHNFVYSVIYCCLLLRKSQNWFLLGCMIIHYHVWTSSLGYHYGCTCLYDKIWLAEEFYQRKEISSFFSSYNNGRNQRVDNSFSICTSANGQHVSTYIFCNSSCFIISFFVDNAVRISVWKSS